MCKGHFWDIVSSLWKGLHFPCSCPIWTIALGVNLRAQLPSSYFSPAMEHGWQEGEWPQSLWDKPEGKVSKGPAWYLESKWPFWGHAFLEALPSLVWCGHLRAAFFKVGVWYLKHVGKPCQSDQFPDLSPDLQSQTLWRWFLQAHSDKSAHENLRILS